MPLDLKAMRELHARTTPGKWRDQWDDVADQDEDKQQAIVTDAPVSFQTVVGLMPWNNGPNVVIRQEDCAFIVAAHEQMPALLDAVEAGDVAIEALRVMATSKTLEAKHSTATNYCRTELELVGRILGRNVTQERNGLLAELESLRAEVARLRRRITTGDLEEMVAFDKAKAKAGET